MFRKYYFWAEIFKYSAVHSSRAKIVLHLIPINTKVAFTKNLVEYLYVNRPVSLWLNSVKSEQGRIQGDDWGDRPPPKIYESNFIHHDFVQFGQQHLHT